MTDAERDALRTLQDKLIAIGIRCGMTEETEILTGITVAEFRTTLYPAHAEYVKYIIDSHR